MATDAQKCPEIKNWFTGSMVELMSGNPAIMLTLEFVDGTTKTAGVLTVQSARRFGMHVLECAEAACTDAAFIAFLEKKLNLDRQQAATMLGELRDFRQKWDDNIEFDDGTDDA